MNHFLATFQKLGLTEKESSLYLSALRQGDSSMAELAIGAGLKRSTAYLTAESLEQKGLLGSYETKSGLRYRATNPKTFLARTEQTVGELQKIIPEINAFIYKEDKKPTITYYEGYEGYVSALESALIKPNTTIYHVGSIMEAHKVYADYDNKHFVPTRIKKNIFIKCLYFPSISNSIKQRNHSAELREIRYLPSGFEFPTATLICEDKVIITSSSKEMITVVIESKDITESERVKFELFWNLVGPGNSSN